MSTTSRTKSPQLETVAIVGGGITGVHMALLCSQLKPAPRIVLFEQAGSLGGRALTYVDAGGNHFPMGAWRYHRERTPYTAQLIEGLGLPRSAWRYRLKQVRIAGKCHEVNQTTWRERSSWSEGVYGGKSLHERLERFDRLWSGTRQYAADAPAGMSTRELIVLTSGYNCLARLPAHCARDLFAKMAERNPQGWLVPDGGFIAVLEALRERLPPTACIHAGHRLVGITRERHGARFSLVFLTGDRHRIVKADKVILAIGGQDLARLGGNVGPDLQRVGSLVRFIPKFRTWLHYGKEQMARLPLDTNSILITDECPRKIYIGDDNVMVYNDLEDAAELGRIASAGGGALHDMVVRALRAFCPQNGRMPDRPKAAYWKHWPFGVQYLHDESDNRALDRLPEGLVVANEAFSPAHGFVEGGLMASYAGVRKLFADHAAPH